jgi:hypothetical protein
MIADLDHQPLEAGPIGAPQLGGNKHADPPLKAPPAT